MQAESYIVRRLHFVKQKQLNDSSHRVSIFAAALHAAHEAYLNDKHVTFPFLARDQQAACESEARILVLLQVTPLRILPIAIKATLTSNIVFSTRFRTYTEQARSLGALTSKPMSMVRTVIV